MVVYYNKFPRSLTLIVNWTLQVLLPQVDYDTCWEVNFPFFRLKPDNIWRRIVLRFSVTQTGVMEGTELAVMDHQSHFLTIAGESQPFFSPISIG